MSTYNVHIYVKRIKASKRRKIIQNNFKTTSSFRPAKNCEYTDSFFRLFHKEQEFYRIKSTRKRLMKKILQGDEITDGEFLSRGKFTLKYQKLSHRLYYGILDLIYSN